MKNFQFYNPTKVIFGCTEFKNIGPEVKSLGLSALLIKQEGPLEKMGVYAKAHQYMKDSGVTAYDLDGITSNPKLSKIEEGITLVKAKKIEVIVAVGGGSAIDTAKAVAFGALDDGDVWDFFTRERTIQKSLPVIAVSTISATGAETSCHCVVTNDRNPNVSEWKKWAVHDAHAFPKTAIIDPELLLSVPVKLTAAGMADTISHIIEGYFDGIPDNPISDRIGEGIVMTVLENDGVLANPNDVSARGAISWAATLAMNGLQDCGRSNEGFPAHWIQHAVGALTDSSHGEGLAVINPAWLELINAKDPKKFVQFTERVFRIQRTPEMSEVEYGQLGISMLKAKFKSWGLPTTLKDLGVTEEMLPILVKNIMDSPETYVFSETDLMKVLKSCLG
ncbi:MAG: iron-containing alcohol dehydrogenase [Eubacteriales bacterium]